MIVSPKINTVHMKTLQVFTCRRRSVRRVRPRRRPVWVSVHQQRSRDRADRGIPLQKWKPGHPRNHNTTLSDSVDRKPTHSAESQAERTGDVCTFVNTAECASPQLMKETPRGLRAGTIQMLNLPVKDDKKWKKQWKEWWYMWVLIN